MSLKTANTSPHDILSNFTSLLLITQQPSSILIPIDLWPQGLGVSIYQIPHFTSYLSKQCTWAN